MNPDFVCVLSGVTPAETHPIDVLGDGTQVPRGWIVLTIQQSSVNPRWVEIMDSKSGATSGMLAQLEAGLPPDASAQEKATARRTVEHLADAQWHSLVAATSEFEVSEEQVYVDVTQAAVKTEWDKIAALLSG